LQGGRNSAPQPQPSRAYQGKSRGAESRAGVGSKKRSKKGIVKRKKGRKAQGKGLKIQETEKQNYGRPAVRIRGNIQEKPMRQEKREV